MSSSAIPSSLTKSNPIVSTTSSRTPLKDIQGVQEHVDNVCASVMNILEESDANPFGTRSKLVCDFSVCILISLPIS